VILSLAGMACTPPSAARADLDREVGQASINGIEVSVDDGLATVHELESGRLRLWCSAPEIVIHVRSEGARSLVLELFNAMGDTTVSASGEEAIVEDLVIPTRKRVSLDLNDGDNEIAITTSDTGEAGPWRFALMSDVQGGIDEVQDIFRSINSEDDVRFLLGAGDLSSTGSREELERFAHELETLDVPYYTTLGNHDVPVAGLWQELYGRGNFRFVFRGVQFTLLDSASATIDPLAYSWLDRWLYEGLSRVNIFAMHIPALDPVGTRNGAFGSRNEAGKLLSSLHAGNVALTLYGHIHSFYQYENGGIQAFISGGGGALPERGDGYGRHYMLIDVGAEAGIVSTKRVEIDP
jgi:predicted phosphodiesterase